MTDVTDSGLPLLLSLVDELHLNGLRAFKNLAAYSNVKHDPAVHYSTSSIRHRRFETIVDVENLALPAIIVDDFPDAEIIDDVIDKDNFEMKILAKLNLLPWNRYAVIPSRPLLAHVDIIIKSEYWNEQHGYPVIAHLLDNFQHRPTKPGILRSVSSLIQNQHLIVIVPGHDSISHDLLPFADALRNKYPKPYYNIVVPACNDWKTSDGISKGSARLFAWLQDLLSVSPVSKISFIGESVGGLYARTVVGLLHSASIIPDLIEPCNFITISTQHLGVRRNTNFKLTSRLLSPLMSQTGQQLNLLDDEQYLLMLSSERFVTPLSQFKNLILYFPSKPEQIGYFSTWAISTVDEQKLKSKLASTKIIAVDTSLEPVDVGSTSETPERKIVNQLGQLPWKRYCISSSSHSRKANWTFSKHHPLLKHILQELKAS